MHARHPWFRLAAIGMALLAGVGELLALQASRLREHASHDRAVR